MPRFKYSTTHNSKGHRTFGRQNQQLNPSSDNKEQFNDRTSIHGNNRTTRCYIHSMAVARQTFPVKFLFGFALL